MTDWLPIETAPKDGTRVDGWMNGRRIPNAFWFEPEENWCVDSVYGPDEPTALGLPSLTHWMPVPEPPGTLDNGSRGITNEQVNSLVRLSLEMLEKANNPPIYLRPEDMYRPDSDLDTRMRKIVAFARHEFEGTLGAGVKSAMTTILALAEEK